MRRSMTRRRPPRVEGCTRTGRSAMLQQPSEHNPAPMSDGGGPPLTPLTSRQREVAALIAEGLSNMEIAQRLVLAPGTVANHVAHITRALGARNRVQVAVWAVEQGLYRS